MSTSIVVQTNSEPVQSGAAAEAGIRWNQVPVEQIAFNPMLVVDNKRHFFAGMMRADDDPPVDRIGIHLEEGAGVEVSDVSAKNACVFVECEAGERDDVHDVSPSVDAIIVYRLLPNVNVDLVYQMWDYIHVEQRGVDGGSGQQFHFAPVFFLVISCIMNYIN